MEESSNLLAKARTEGLKDLWKTDSKIVEEETTLWKRKIIIATEGNNTGAFLEIGIREAEK